MATKTLRHQGTPRDLHLKKRLLAKKIISTINLILRFKKKLKLGVPWCLRALVAKELTYI